MNPEHKMRFSNSLLKGYMERCIELTHNMPSALPHPYVGAIVVASDGKVIGEGYRSFVPDTSLLMHAERMAINSAKAPTKGATLVSTLEPCYKRLKRNVIFKSCSEMIVEAGIACVVMGSLDNAPSMEYMAGSDYLSRHGIEVVVFNGLQDYITNHLSRPGRTRSFTAKHTGPTYRRELEEAFNLLAFEHGQSRVNRNRNSF